MILLLFMICFAGRSVGSVSLPSPFRDEDDVASVGNDDVDFVGNAHSPNAHGMHNMLPICYM